MRACAFYVYVCLLCMNSRIFFLKKKKRNSYTTQAMGQVFEAYARGANNQTPALFFTYATLY